jgi:hypothetical protein
MTSSVWPYDTFAESIPSTFASATGAIKCFVAFPFEPQQRWNDLFDLVQAVCSQIHNSLGIPIECKRANFVRRSGITHSEIWQALRTSDIVICDVSGQDGNVILELGVASAWRPKENVLILCEKGDEKPRLFDMNPAGSLEYEISFSGFSTLTQDLLKVIPKIIARSPAQLPDVRSVSLPFFAALTDRKDNPALLTQGLTHRRVLDDCLEFGSPFVHRYSWMSLGELSLATVHVRAELKMTLDTPLPDRLMGIMLRGQTLFANFGHLVLVRPDGTVHLATRDDRGRPQDQLLMTIPDFNMRDFTQFDITIDDAAISGQIDRCGFTKRLAELPYVFSSGKVVFIAGQCRVGIRNVLIE